METMPEYSSVSLGALFLLLGMLFESYFRIGSNTSSSFSESNKKGHNDLKGNLTSVDIVIGILSARENFKSRDVLRRTWIKYISTTAPKHDLSIMYRFIIGNQVCEVPLLERLSPYTCDRDSYLKLSQGFARTHYFNQVSVHGNFIWHGSIGFDFETLHDIIITEIGVFDDGGDGISDSIQATLYDSRSKEKYLSLSFDSETPNILIGGFRYQNISELMVPKGFHGTVAFDGFSERDKLGKDNKNCITNDGEGLIRIRKTFRFGLLPNSFPGVSERHHETLSSFVIGSFKFQPYEDVTSFHPSKKSRERLKRYQEEEQSSKEVQEKLLNESKTFQDILEVDVVDVYRNLPMKIKKFALWVSSSFFAKYLIKTDDDCFLNIPRILEGIRENKIEKKERVWWSRFRHNWPLDTFGKWEEEEYPAPVYPSFACGGGNLLSMDLINWIAKNENYLKAFQGEDVSLGIWLAPVGPRIIDDYNWMCVKECIPTSYNIPNNSPEELLNLYENERTCNNPCGCPRKSTDGSRGP